jgi:hypothetical protein
VTSLYKVCSRAIVPAVVAALGCSFGNTEPRPTPASIRILQASPFTVTLGDDAERLTAEVVDTVGFVITSRVRIAWSSADTNVVEVDQTGRLNPRNGGLATVRASVDAHGAPVQDSIVVDVGIQIPLSRSSRGLPE